MDYIVNFTDEESQVSLCVAKTTEMVETMRKIHNPTPVVCAAMGRLMTATSIMGTMMKDEKNRITTIIKGSGPIGNITCVGDQRGYIKACATNYLVDLPLRESDNKLDVSKAVGLPGVLTVIKDLGLKKPYIGNNELVTGEIAEDLTAYYAKSEQIPSSVGLGVLVDTDYSIKQAGGFILTLLPFTKEETIEKLEENLKDIKSVTTLMEEGNSPEDIAKIILRGMGAKQLSKKEIKYECDCSKEKIEKALISLGEKEIKTIYDEDQKADIQCHFCNSEYHFDKSDLERILKVYSDIDE